MLNYYTMAIPMEEKKYKSRAMLVTAVFAACFTLLMFIIVWKLPDIILPVSDSAVEVELNLPPDPPQALADGGGGGGNPVHAAGPAGIAKYSPPPEGKPEPSKSIDENTDKEAVTVTKPIVTKTDAKKIVVTSVPKPQPKPIEEVPAPRIPKAVLGHTTYGSSNGGNNSTDDYTQNGGKGNGFGVGNGNGSGGGKGNGTGGGNGTGSGSGNGPKITRGDRRIVRYYAFDGDLEKAVIYANVNVSPEGVGSFVSIAKGSTYSGGAYKDAIMRYLENIRFDKADHESMLTVQFNFKVN